MYYNVNSGRLFIASSFSLSIARVYFSVCFSPECPKRLATVLMFAPLFNMFTANECRPQCHVICLSMPARFTHLLKAFRHIVWLGKGNIGASLPSPSLGCPIRLKMPSFNGIITPLLAECPFVLFCSNFNSLLE